MLLLNHIIRLLLESRHSSNQDYHQLLMEKLISKQRLKIKGSIIDANNRLNGIFKSFNLFNNKFSPWNRLIDLFSSHFSFYLSDRKYVDTRKIHLCKLDEVVFNALADPKTAVIVLDTSIKNNITTSISYIHTYNSPVIKTIYHTINVTSTKAELFVIRYGLNQAIWLSSIKYIIVITNSIHTVKKIFDSSVHPYQIQTLSISKEIREFFERNHHDFLEFRIVQVKTNRYFTILLIKRPRISIYLLYFLASLYGNLVKRMNAMNY